MVYQFKQEQELPISLQEAWEFFSAPKNLAKITPDKMGFVILGDEPQPMYAGQVIQYTVKPLFNIPMRWVTEITHVNEPYFFVDEQRKGPYTMWHHQHFFEETEQGVLMTDIVTYEPPLGFLGQIANAVLIKSELKQIFDYRREYLEKRFC